MSSSLLLPDQFRSRSKSERFSVSRLSPSRRSPSRVIPRLEPCCVPGKAVLKSRKLSPRRLVPDRLSPGMCFQSESQIRPRNFRDLSPQSYGLSHFPIEQNCTTFSPVYHDNKNNNFLPSINHKPNPEILVTKSKSAFGFNSNYNRNISLLPYQLNNSNQHTLNKPIRENILSDHQLKSLEKGSLDKPDLIMPSLLSFFKSESSAKKPVRRDPSSSRNFSEASSMRKCNTMVSLSTPGSNGDARTKLLRERKSPLSFFKSLSASTNQKIPASHSPPRIHTLQKKRKSGFSFTKDCSAEYSRENLEEHERLNLSQEQGRTSQKHSLETTLDHSRIRPSSFVSQNFSEKPEKSTLHSLNPEGFCSTQSHNISKSPSIDSIGEILRASNRSLAPSTLLRASNGILRTSNKHLGALNAFDANENLVFCKLCLTEVPADEIFQLQQCHCRFCSYCMCVYTSLKIREGETSVECPDSNCEYQSRLSLMEIEAIVGAELLDMHLKFKADKEIDQDPYKTWCPEPACGAVISLPISKFGKRPQCAACHACGFLLCATCSSSWHPRKACFKNEKKLRAKSNDNIKKCPGCRVFIERDAGCAQMQCKKCKHVFCWHCLTSLEDDFLLRHYDKGPCKDKLGHSRASVIWHRAQVMVIFASFGVLLVIASTLLLFFGPCMLCRGCKNFSPDDESIDSNSRRSSGSSGDEPTANF